MRCTDDEIRWITHNHKFEWCFFFQDLAPTKDAAINGSGASTPITPTQESIALKKALEWELSLDKSDLRSHAWYYATIPRQRAEELVEKDGDFLVRDCVSQPGNFVLTCMSKGSTLHFVINKVGFLVLSGFFFYLFATCYVSFNLIDSMATASLFNGIFFIKNR